MLSDRPMRIDLVITELFVGGAERCLTHLAIGLQERGHAVRVASLGSLPEGQQAELARRLEERKITIESARCDRSRDLFRARRWLRDWLAQNPPDLVQAMLYHANVMTAWAARSAGVRPVVGGIRVAEHSPVRQLIERRAVARMDGVVCVSRSVERFAQAAFGAALPTTRVIPNAIDLTEIDRRSAFAWSRIGWPDDSQVLLFVGRLHPQKGTDVLATAVADLLHRFPEMRCCLVGEGPQRPELQRIADAIGTDRFRLVGWRSDALEMMRACRLLVLPSRYEGMPNVVLEAMASGKPVAVSLVEGVAELLADDAPEQTCRPNDPAALQRLIATLWPDLPTLVRLGRQNRTRAAQMHGLAAMVDRYESFYKHLVFPR